MGHHDETHEEPVRVPTEVATLDGDLAIPRGATGIVIFAHGSGSSRHSVRNRQVAKHLNDGGLATLLLDLLTGEEEMVDMHTAQLRFNIEMLAERLADAAEWVSLNGSTRTLSRGYFGASVRDVVKAAGVPQGSFTNHFSSKEAFAGEVLDLYFSLVRTNMEKTLRNDARPSLRRLRQWFDVQIAFLKQAKFRSGCLIGNFSAEAGEHSEPIRRRLGEIYREVHRSVVYCLEAAVKGAGFRPLPFRIDLRGLEVDDV